MCEELTHAFFKLCGSHAAKHTFINRERGPAHCRKVEIRGKNMFFPFFYSLFFVYPTISLLLMANPDEITVYNPLYNCGWKSVTLFKQQGKTYNNCIDNVLDNNMIIYYFNVYDVPFGLGFWVFYAVIYLYCSFSS